MPNDDPLPNMTAQEREDWKQAKVNNRAAAERAPHSSAGRGGFRDLLERAQRQAIERATENTRERDGGRSR